MRVRVLVPQFIEVDEVNKSACKYGVCCARGQRVGSEAVLYTCDAYCVGLRHDAERVYRCRECVAGEKLAKENLDV